jgi:hypothetical protein
MAGKLSTGGDVDSWCTKCKIMILHTIVAMVEDKPKKVQCNSCGSNHVFRADPPGTRRSATGRKTTSKSSRGALKPSDYEKLMEGRDRREARRYSPKLEFQKSELIIHPKFGLGIATLLKDQTKVEVLFPEGPKVLVHAR